VRWALAGLSLLLAAGWPAPAAAQFDTGGMASRLKPGMTITQTLLALGYQPTSTADTTCRQPDGDLFTCRIWNYATQVQELQIFFRYDEPRQQWLVYGWRL
jgi:hypothetical protein